MPGNRAEAVSAACGLEEKLRAVDVPHRFHQLRVPDQPVEDSTVLDLVPTGQCA
jgi:hypothetical protein